MFICILPACNYQNSYIALESDSDFSILKNENNDDSSILDISEKLCTDDGYTIRQVINDAGVDKTLYVKPQYSNILDWGDFEYNILVLPTVYSERYSFIDFAVINRHTLIWQDAVKNYGNLLESITHEKYLEMLDETTSLQEIVVAKMEWLAQNENIFLFLKIVIKY